MAVYVLCILHTYMCILLVYCPIIINYSAEDNSSWRPLAIALPVCLVGIPLVTVLIIVLVTCYRSKFKHKVSATAIHLTNKWLQKYLFSFKVLGIDMK